MPWTAAAIVGAALVGAGASYYGSKEISDTTKDSSDNTLEATSDTNAMLQKQYDQTREDNEPWRLAGQEALKSIQETPDFSFSNDDYDFFSDPSYEFRQQEGINALDRSAASRGRLLSGGQDRAVTRYASDLASQEYGNAFARAKSTYDTNLNTQKSLAGVGQQANQSNISSGNSLTQSMANNTMASNNAQNVLAMQGANSTADMYGGMAQSVNQGLGNYLLYDSLKTETSTSKG